MYQPIKLLTFKTLKIIKTNFVTYTEIQSRVAAIFIFGAFESCVVQILSRSIILRIGNNCAWLTECK